MPIARRTTWSKAGKARGTGDAQAPVVGRGCLALPAADAAGIQHILQIDGGRGLRAMPRDPRELGHLARVYAPRRGVRGLPRRLPDRRPRVPPWQFPPAHQARERRSDRTRATWDTWRESPPRGVACAPCHGDSLTGGLEFHLGNFRRLIKHVSGDVPEQIRIKGLDTFGVMEGG